MVYRVSSTRAGRPMMSENDRGREGGGEVLIRGLQYFIIFIMKIVFIQDLRRKIRISMDEHN